MQQLVHGVRQFQDTVFAEKKALFQQLSRGQTPGVLFIACSDSRVDPNLFTQSEPGGLFVIRNPGNIIPSYGDNYYGEAGAIEFAPLIADLLIAL